MNKYVIKYGESLVDVSLKLYGDISYVFDLIKLNPLLENIDNTNIVGLEIVYNAIEKQPVIVAIKNTKTITKNVTIGEKQSIFDLSLQIYGSVENAFDVLKKANVESLNSVDIKGVSFNYDYIPLKIPKYLNDKKIIVSTKSNYTSLDNLVWDGSFDIWDGTFDLGY